MQSMFATVLFDYWKQIVPDSDTVLLVNDWKLEHYKFRHFSNLNSAPLLLGNYGLRNARYRTKKVLCVLKKWQNLLAA